MVIGEIAPWIGASVAALSSVAGAVYTWSKNGKTNDRWKGGIEQIIKNHDEMLKQQRENCQERKESCGKRFDYLQGRVDKGKP